MNRREFSLHLAGAAGALAFSAGGLGLALAPRSALAQGGLVEGKDYLKLKTPIQMAATGKIEVVEFFWYACPHCFAFEPALEPWVAKLPPDVHFRRVPVAFDALKEIHQQIFYTWEAMGLVDQMHTKTFNRFHVAHKPINKEADMMQFAQESGLDVAKVKEAWNSFGVQTKMRQAKSLADSYQITGVPEIGIQGRFTTSPSMAGDSMRALAAADYLIGVVRKGA